MGTITMRLLIGGLILVLSVGCSNAPAATLPTSAPVAASGPEPTNAPAATPAPPLAAATSAPATTSAPLAAGTSAPAATAAGVSTDQAALAARFAATINSGDLDAWTALFAEDAAVDDLGIHRVQGRDAIRSWGQGIVNAGGQFTIASSQTDGNTVTWRHSYRDRGFSSTADTTAVVENGLIRSLAIRTAP